jgi:hypothetical protein
MTYVGEMNELVGEKVEEMYQFMVLTNQSRTDWLHAATTGRDEEGVEFSLAE